MDAAFTNMQPAVSEAGRRMCCIAIDAEEDFDWDNPIQGTPKTTFHLRNLRVLEGILAAYGATPTYLLTYPVLMDPEAVTIIRRQLEKSACAVGLQLHPWVTPPFGDDKSHRASFLGNLDAGQEEQKLLALRSRFIECFGFEPRVYRAGRYGLSEHTPALLEKHGFTIDTSIAPRTDFSGNGGPDYIGQDNTMFWFGAEKKLLEVPLCRSIVGWGGARAQQVYQALAEHGDHRFGLMALMARSRYAERITLSPEGNDVTAMRRLVNGLLARGQTILPLSFHSSSLQAGHNPYVRSVADLHGFYDRLSAILDHMATKLGFTFGAIEDIPRMLIQPRPATTVAPAAHALAV